MIKSYLTMVFAIFLSFGGKSAQLYIPMDEGQTNHLKAYGVTYWAISKGITVDWLLNYKGGSFSAPHSTAFEKECLVKGVSYQILADAQYAKILSDISQPEINQDVVKLEKTPKIAVYSPKTKQPWDDAVTLALTYAEIPYDVVYDEEVLQGKLPLYDWLHLHHEDFTGQYGKFWASYRDAAWYKAEVKEAESIAKQWSYSKVSQMKLAIVLKIKDFLLGGGYLFAMCSATDTYDITSAAEGVDIIENMFDGDPADKDAQKKLDFSKTLAFTNFQLEKNPYEYEHSSIDATHTRPYTQEKNDFFSLFDFSAKWDQIPTMLCQNHTQVVKAFYGQTTAFNKKYIKPNVLVMGENKSLNEVRYMHGEVGKGMWTFYSGHDPEDYQHQVGEPPTDLALHPNSPGYRLILNNVLFPSAKKKKKKT